MASLRLSLRLSLGEDVAPERFEADWRSSAGSQVELSSQKQHNTKPKFISSELSSLKSGLKIAAEHPKGRRRSVAPQCYNVAAVMGWVQCDGCDTWRQISQEKIDVGLPDEWFCSMAGESCTKAARPATKAPTKKSGVPALRCLSGPNCLPLASQ